MQGKVFLVGAGPGDADLLTVGGSKALQQAEVVVYDRLADKRILRYAPAGAEFIYVGKKSAQHTMPQEEICQLLAAKAKAGKKVVRLKGGDPFVFGRGGEEIAVLREAGIPFQVVPGVTSAIAAPAYAGIPVTHRGVAASFAVVTGHEAPGKEKSSLNWEKLATAVDTLVFLMGIKNIQEISEKLQQYGRDGSTPAAFIRWGTKPEQEVWTTTLGEAASLVKTENIQPPAVFVVGDVVRLRQDFAWFSPQKGKLAGELVVVTRPEGQHEEMAAAIEEAGAECLLCPAIDFAEPDDHYQALDAAISVLEQYSWLIFTSVHGVTSFFDRLAARQLDARALGGLKIAVIGEVTAKALAFRGIKADLVPEKFQAEYLLAALQPEIEAGMKVLLVRAQEARMVLPEGLKAMGVDLTVAAAYKTIYGQRNFSLLKEKLAAGKVSWLTFTSPSTLQGTVNGLGGDSSLLKQAKIACIGEITAAACRRLGLCPQVTASEYTARGLVEAVKNYAAAEQ